MILFDQTRGPRTEAKLGIPADVVLRRSSLIAIVSNVDVKAQHDDANQIWKLKGLLHSHFRRAWVNKTPRTDISGLL